MRFAERVREHPAVAGGGHAAPEPGSRSRATFGGVVVTLCLIYLMLRPVGSNEVLIPVLGVLGLTAAGLAMAHRRRVSPLLVPCIALFAMVVALGSVVGIDNPGWAYALITWVAGPVAFGLWAVALRAPLLRLTMLAAAWATIALSAFIVLYVGAQAGILPSVIPPVLLEESGAGFDGTGPATVIRLYGLSTLAAAAPMWTASLLVGAHPWLPGVALRLAAGASAIAAVMLGGRRAIILTVLLTPLIVAALRMLTATGRRARVPRWVAVTGILAVPAAAILAPRVLEQAAVQRALRALADFFSPDQGAVGVAVRTDQSRILLDEAAQRPLFGHGFGAVLESGYARNLERPWEFELQYHLLAFQVGALGIVLLCIAACCAVAALRRAALLDPSAAPVLIVTATGAIAMLVANASNPYLQAPGHMWAIALALGAVNTVLVSGDGQRHDAALRPTGSAGSADSAGSLPRAAGSSDAAAGGVGDAAAP
ncbi:hypothetical protein SAMN04489719_2107 [Agrococcus carbonis]|uniref:O-antigen ligase n=1 Tax=Agrococcus carbonis TaxID=684552 RepID=A0A1H1RFN6_9MICO|nr:hypothetical protein SAMN04489719_2107 [Agrococcus carbonis]